MSRCWGCCQENCDSRPCSCSCHSDNLINIMTPKAMMTQTTAKPEKCPCKKHHSYKGIRAPRTPCELCWRFYIKQDQ